MLEIAYINKDELQKKFLSIAFVDKYKYYVYNSFFDYTLDIKDSSWEALEFVSKKDGKIIGYLKATINRPLNYVDSLRVINFGDKDIEFSRDFRQFLIDIFEKYDFRKINFCVAIGNPAEHMYDRFVKKYGGRIAGLFEQDVKLWTGEYCDSKFYEITKENYMKARR